MAAAVGATYEVQEEKEEENAAGRDNPDPRRPRL